MDTEQWLLLGSYVLTGLIALLNKVWKSKVSSKIDESTYINSLNANIALANERALKTDKDAVDTEARFDEREKRLIKRIDDLESKLNLTVQENKTLKSEMAEMHMKQAMSDKLIDEQKVENQSLKERMTEMNSKQIASEKLIEEQRMAQTVSQRLIEEQRREIIALQDFSERLITQVVGNGDSPVQYKPNG